jgi:hypothetical protein
MLGDWEGSFKGGLNKPHDGAYLNYCTGYLPIKPVAKPVATVTQCNGYLIKVRPLFNKAQERLEFEITL